ncbi:4-hydroxy-tetrahydrodipicolinate synthase [Chitinimonas sp.]|uniref:4-hydroxy-tetrahydrodipicolinate synthase n=1 Tax=Chitinimonas sp. TaxID=1934313 RepID=UPI0035ADB05E
MQQFSGIWIPLITPFRDGAVDLPAAQGLIETFHGSGIAGLVICGTTGEAATLSATEQRQLLAAAQEAAGPELPIMFGLAGNDTAAVCAAARALNDIDLAALLVSAPYYTRPSQAGLLRHFEQLAASTRHRIVLYNIPYRSGVNLGIDTCRALASHPQFVAIKESNGIQLDQLGELIDSPLQVLCGEDSLAFVAGCLGADGAIAASAHLRPDLWVAMFQHLAAGRLAAARDIHRQLLPMVRLLFSEPNPAPLKAVLASEGMIRNELRLPMLPASAALEAQLQDCWQRLRHWQPDTAPKPVNAAQLADPAI